MSEAKSIVMQMPGQRVHRLNHQLRVEIQFRRGALAKAQKATQKLASE